jgi:hypothetical protein
MSVRATRPAPNRPVGDLRIRALNTKKEDARAMASTDVTAQPLLRREIGDVLRTVRQQQRRTLREVSSQAQVSLGYLSEVERGQKEASSELLEAITGALGVPLWFVLREVSDRMAAADRALVPDTVPDDLMPVALIG